MHAFRCTYTTQAITSYAHTFCLFISLSLYLSANTPTHISTHIHTPANKLTQTNTQVLKEKCTLAEKKSKCLTSRDESKSNLAAIVQMCVHEQKNYKKRHVRKTGRCNTAGVTGPRT